MKRKCTITAILFYLQTVFFLSFPPLSAAPIAEEADKFLGNIISGAIPSNYNEYWNQVTPENAGKWGMVERRRDQMSWSGLDDAYRYAKEHGCLFKQHAFVWGNQVPSWVANLSEEEQRAEVEEWIRLFGERYPETDYIDVVNEPVNAPAGYREVLGGSGETGYDWVVTSYELARTYCPNAKLLINDFYMVSNEALATIYLEIINILKERGLLDGVGVQAHSFSIQWMDTIPPPPPEVIKSNLDLLATAGLPIYVSELDIYGNDTTQLMQYQDLFPLFWEHPAVAGVTLWGWVEGHTWAPNTYLYDDDGERSALKWLREYVASHPMGITEPLTISGQGARHLSIRQTGNGVVSLQVQQEQKLTIRITDLFGRTVAGRQPAFYPAGIHRIPLADEPLSPGRYPGSVMGPDGQVNFLLTVVK